MAKQKGAVRKIFSWIITLAIIGATVFMVVKTDLIGKIKNMFDSVNGPEIETPVKLPKVEKPTGVVFDQISGKITWNSNAKADGYNVTVNGKSYSSATNSLTLENFDKKLEIKVQAKGDDIHYSNSDWSDTLNYTVAEEDKTSFAFQKAYILNLLNENKEMYIGQRDSIEIKNIESVTFKNGELSILTNSDVGFMGTIYRSCMPFEISFDKQVNVINDIFDKKVNLVSCDLFILSPYSATESLLESESYDGELQKFYEQAYKITLLDSMTTKYDDSDTSKPADYYTFFTVKLEKAGITKYASFKYNIRIHDAVVTGKDNYTWYVATPAERTVREEMVNVHEGEDEKFMIALLQDNGKLTPKE